MPVVLLSRILSLLLLGPPLCIASPWIVWPLLHLAPGLSRHPPRPQFVSVVPLACPGPEILVAQPPELPLLLSAARWPRAQPSDTCSHDPQMLHRSRRHEHMLIMFLMPFMQASFAGGADEDAAATSFLEGPSCRDENYVCLPACMHVCMSMFT